MQPTFPTLTPAFCGLIAATLLTSSAAAQDTLFSIDWHGPTNGAFDSLTGTAITNGDVLAPPGGSPSLGPLPAPEMIIPNGLGGLGLFPGCSAPGAGVPCRTEVDALSLGVDERVQPGQIMAGALQFSVDSFAMGTGLAAPNVVTEAPVGDAAADVMRNIEPILAPPIAPGVSLGHRGLFDGDGLVSGSGFVYDGLGLIEPTGPAWTPATAGDNLDAMELLSPGATPSGDVYFSLDAFWMDPITGYTNTGTAITNGFSSSDVLVVTPGSTPGVYAPSVALGLDFFGPNQPDDLDALILWENGDGIYTPSLQPFDWMSGTTDMLLFSVRRGSPVIGMPDSIFGIPICEGDVLTTPLPTGLGGLSPFPGIFVAAERLGLGTLRSGTASGNTSDDLDALDHRQEPFDDCDGDGIDDNLAIALGMVPDVNMNGIPDGCEGTSVCTPLPNSTGVPTDITIGFTGSPGTGVHMDGFDGPPGEFGYFLIGTGLSTTGLASGSGILCLETTGGNLIARYSFPGPMNSIGRFDALGNFENLVGTSTTGYGYDIPTTIPTPIGGTISAGSTWHFQLWHRDVPTTWNFSNAVTYTF